MFEGSNAIISKVENGFIVQHQGRQYLHPSPLTALGVAADALGIAVALMSRADHDRLMGDLRRGNDTANRLADDLDKKDLAIKELQKQLDEALAKWNSLVTAKSSKRKPARSVAKRRR